MNGCWTSCSGFIVCGEGVRYMNGCWTSCSGFIVCGEGVRYMNGCWSLCSGFIVCSEGVRYSVLKVFTALSIFFFSTFRYVTAWNKAGFNSFSFLKILHIIPHNVFLKCLQYIKNNKYNMYIILCMCIHSLCPILCCGTFGEFSLLWPEVCLLANLRQAAVGCYHGAASVWPLHPYLPYRPEWGSAAAMVVLLEGSSLSTEEPWSSVRVTIMLGHLPS